MACSACAKQRKRVTTAARRGNFAKAAKETARGAGMMTGVLPKTAKPKPKTQTDDKGK